MSAPSLLPFAHALPYWATRSVRTGTTTTSVLILVDGTLVVGFRQGGVDTFSADDSVLNKSASALRRALNALPADHFLQSEWRTGGSYEQLIDGYEDCGTGSRGSGPNAAASVAVSPVLLEQRAARAAMLRADRSLIHGALTLYVGARHALGNLLAPRPSLLSRVLSFGARDPMSVTARDIEEATKRLSEVALRVKDELALAGVVLAPLDEGALLSEIYAALNPVTALGAPLRVVERPAELPEEDYREPGFVVLRPLSVREQLPLSDLSVSDDSLSLDDVPHRVLSLERLPAFTRPDFMMGVQYATRAAVRLVQTFIATDRERLAERLIRRRNVAHAQAGGIVRDVAADVAYVEYEHILEKMLTEDQSVFVASVSAVVRSGSDDELSDATRNVKDAFSDQGSVITTESGRQLKAFLATLPGFGFSAPKKHQLITNNAADFLPTFLSSVGDERAELLYHTRQSTLRRMSLHSSARANNNAVVFGGSGSGKSFNMAAIFEQACLFDGSPLFVIDVQGPELSSYRALTEIFGGMYVSLATDESVSFSPFISREDLVLSDGHTDAEALRMMASLVAVMALPELSVRRERALALDVARVAIERAYEATSAMATAPVLSDVVAALSRLTPKHEEHRAVAREMFVHLETWTKDPLRARLLDRQASGPRGLKRAGAVPMQVFDFFSMEKDRELSTVLLMSVSFQIWNAMKSAPREQKKLVVFDECWKLLSHPVASEMVAELFRTGRKWGASVFAITQSLNDFLSSPVHSAVLSNAARVFLLQHATDHGAVSDVCGLTTRERELFLSLAMKKGSYSEMLLVDRGLKEASVLQLRPTAFDVWLNTTDPRDVGLRSRVMKERGLDFLAAVRFLAERYPHGAPHETGQIRGAPGAGGAR